MADIKHCGGGLTFLKVNQDKTHPLMSMCTVVYNHVINNVLQVQKYVPIMDCKSKSIHTGTIVDLYFEYILSI